MSEHPSVKQILAAQQEGYESGWAGEHALQCPYPKDPPILRRAWAAGMAAAHTDLRERHGLPANHGHLPTGDVSQS